MLSSRMTDLSSLERAALKAVLDEPCEGCTDIEKQLLGATILSRENTGRGFFTELALPNEIPAHAQGQVLGKNVWFGVEGMSHGLGMILHLSHGKTPLLEGYAIGPEDTSRIDFERVRFALIEEPGPISANGG